MGSRLAYSSLRVVPHNLFFVPFLYDNSRKMEILLIIT